MGTEVLNTGDKILTERLSKLRKGQSGSMESTTEKAGRMSETGKRRRTGKIREHIEQTSNVQTIK